MINPSAVHLARGILSLNVTTKILHGTNEYFEAKKLAATIRLVLSRYREVAKSVTKKQLVLSKAICTNSGKVVAMKFMTRKPNNSS